VHPRDDEMTTNGSHRGRDSAHGASGAGAHGAFDAGGEDARPDPDDRFRWRRDRTAALLVVLAALATFALGLGHDFVFDDVPVIAGDPRLEHPFELGPIFGAGYWAADASGATRLWRPLTTWSFALGRLVHGPGPGGVLAINWLLNAACSVLVFALACRIVRRRDVALLAGLVFAVHPVHVEVVSNGVGRGELLAAAFSLAAILLHLGWLDRRGEHAAAPRGRPAAPGPQVDARFAAALVCYGLAMLAKESAAVVPGLIFLCDWFGREGGRLRPMLRPARLAGYFAYAIPLAAVVAGRAEVIGLAAPQVAEVMVGATPTQRIVLALDVIARTTAQLAVPITLAAEYSDYRRLVREITPADAVLPLLACGLLAGGIVAAALRGRRAIALGLLFLLLAGLPTNNLLVAIGTIRGDRLLYLSSAGFAIAFAAIVLRFVPAGRPATIATAVVAALLAGRAVVRIPAWKTEASLVRATVIDSPGNAPSWARLGDLERGAGDFAAAEAAYDRALALYARVDRAPAVVRLGRARALAAAGETARAETAYRTLVASEPDFLPARLDLGGLLYEADRLEDAVEAFDDALARMPDAWEPRANRAVVLSDLGRHDEALADVRRVLRDHPTNGAAYRIYAAVLEAAGETAAAAEVRRRLGDPAPGRIGGPPPGGG